MQFVEKLRQDLAEGTKLVCICEGPSERSTLEILLDQDCLLFKNTNIIGDIYAPRNKYANKNFTLLEKA